MEKYLWKSLYVQQRSTRVDDLLFTLLAQTFEISQIPATDIHPKYFCPAIKLFKGKLKPTGL
jgi:hypothetical protein